MGFIHYGSLQDARRPAVSLPTLRAGEAAAGLRGWTGAPARIRRPALAGSAPGHPGVAGCFFALSTRPGVRSNGPLVLPRALPVAQTSDTQLFEGVGRCPCPPSAGKLVWFWGSGEGPPRVGGTLDAFPEWITYLFSDQRDTKPFLCVRSGSGAGNGDETHPLSPRTPGGWGHVGLPWGPFGIPLRGVILTGVV